jgi:hypothetical protein
VAESLAWPQDSLTILLGQFGGDQIIFFDHRGGSTALINQFKGSRTTFFWLKGGSTDVPLAMFGRCMAEPFMWTKSDSATFELFCVTKKVVRPPQ